MINKKGEKYLSIWWFFVIGIIGAGLVVGVSIFNSADIDIRKIESNILANKVIDCLIKDSVNQDFLDSKLSNSFDIFKECELDKSIIHESNKYYLLVEAYGFDDLKNQVAKQEFGVSSYKADCEATKTARAAGYPKCTERFVYVLDKLGNKIILRVYAGSNQRGGREVIKDD